jgi:hypothetical protein
MASLASMARRGRTSPRRDAPLDPREFGMGPLLCGEKPARPLALSDDLRLFAYTFLAGFVFVSVLIG